MRAELDQPTRVSNLEDHGVDFKDAARIFEASFSRPATSAATLASNAIAAWAVSATTA